MRVVPLPEHLQVGYTVVAVMILVAVTAVFWLPRAGGESHQTQTDTCVKPEVYAQPYSAILAENTRPGGGTRTSPAPVFPGDTVLVDIVWDPAQWQSLETVEVCVGSDLGTLSVQETAPLNDAAATLTHIIPGLRSGALVCDVVTIAGRRTGSGAQSFTRGGEVCFFILEDPASTIPGPTVTTTVTTTTVTPSTVAQATTTSRPAGSPAGTAPPTTAVAPTGVAPTTLPAIGSGTAAVNTNTPQPVPAAAAGTGGARSSTSPSPAAVAGTGVDSAALFALALVVLNLGATLLVNAKHD